MKSILISIKPRFVAKILNREKTIEIRKSYPKCDLPIQVYIYCTKSNYLGYISKRYIGKVVAKFTLNKVEEIKTCEMHSAKLLDRSCLNANEFYDYLTKGKNFLGQVLGYAWHISNLEIFDKPKELSEFRSIKQFMPSGYMIDPLTKAPQSWQFVESESTNEK